MYLFQKLTIVTTFLLSAMIQPVCLGCPVFNISELKDEWDKRKYKSVAPKLKCYFNNQEKSVDVAYWLATSLCRIKETDRGEKLLLKIREGETDRNNIQILQNELNSCGSNDFPQEVVSIRLMSGGSGWDPPGTVPPKREFQPRYEYEAFLEVRRFKLSAPQLAIKNVRDTFKDAEVQQIGSYFISVCLKCDQDKQNLKELGLELDKYIAYLSQEFGLEIPNNFITIYFVNNGAALKKLHGVQLSNKTVYIVPTGEYIPFLQHYSLLGDMSIVLSSGETKTWITEKSKHHLFHLINRSESSFNAPWLDEGIAGFLENSSIENGTMIGRTNSRKGFLLKNWNSRPSIKQLISYERLEFISEQSPFSHDPFFSLSSGDLMADNAVMMRQELARWFILYLQHKGKIKEVFKATRSIKITDNYEIKVPESESILKKELSAKSIDDIDKDFTNWFNSLKDKTEKNSERK